MPEKPLKEMNKQELADYYKDRFKRQNEKMKDNYDRVSATLPKGTKGRIKATGISLNKFITVAVEEKLKQYEYPEQTDDMPDFMK